MTPRLRNLTGLLTIAMFLAVGSAFFFDGRTKIGGALLALGLLRSALLIRDLRSDEDD